LSNKLQKYQLKLQGVIFPYFFSTIIQHVRRQVRATCDADDKEVELTMRTDE
jgi:hypothetical protein